MDKPALLRQLFALGCRHSGQVLSYNIALEVKSGRRRDTLPGLAAFAEACKPTRTLLVGADGVPLEQFLTAPVSHWLQHQAS